MKISKKTGAYLLSIASLVFVETSNAQEAEKNILLNTAYTYYPNPEYSHTTDSGDKTDLTDGKYVSTIKTMWKMKSAVGWISKPDTPIVILFELKEAASLSKLTFNTVGGGGSGIMDPEVAVYGSIDNKHYLPLGKLAAPTIPKPAVTYLQKKDIPLLPVRAKYIAVVATPPDPTYFVFVDEIELFGKIPASTESKEITDAKIAASGAKELQQIFIKERPEPKSEGLFSSAYQKIGDLFN